MTLSVEPVSRNRIARPFLHRAIDEMHERLHGHPILAPLVQPDLTFTQYGAAMMAFSGFYRWMATVSTDDKLSAEVAPALGHLNRDLDRISPIGIEPAALTADVPVTVVSDESAGLGMRYVLRGSQFGAAVIYRNVADRLGLGPDDGASYWAWSSRRDKADWSALLDELDRRLDTKETLNRAAHAATAAFAAFATLLDRQQARPGA